MHKAVFLSCQRDLAQRIERQRPRSAIARRLRRQLRDLVLDGLKAKPATALQPVPEADEDEGQELQWFQK